jgi:hypothetical protein
MRREEKRFSNSVTNALVCSVMAEGSFNLQISSMSTTALPSEQRYLSHSVIQRAEKVWSSSFGVEVR